MQNPPPVQVSNQPPVPVSKSSTGLDENIAALLSYVFGWVSGLIFFLIEKDSRLVRFQAMQYLGLDSPRYRPPGWMDPVFGQGFSGPVLQAPDHRKFCGEVLDEIIQLLKDSLVDRINVTQIMVQRKDSIYFLNR